MQAEDVSEIAAQLYALVPAQFTAARDERAQAAKAAGQPEVAAAVRKLARPTMSAWAVNQLVRVEPELLARLLDVAESLQHAQRELAGDWLRELASLRRQVIADLLAAASSAAGQFGQQLSQAALGEVRTTLEAAIADPEAARAVSSGQLSRPLAYAGLGAVDLAAAMATPPAGQRTARPAVSSAGTAARRTGPERSEAAAQAVREALAAEQAAAAATAAAEQTVTRLAEQRLFLRRKIDQLRTQMRAADAKDAELARDEARAKRAHDAAARAQAAASRRLAQARERADRS